MLQIIPTIIAKDFQELLEKIKKVKPYVDWVQLDVMDGKFVPQTTWNNPKELKELRTVPRGLSLSQGQSPGVNLEAHLMVQNPEENIDDWIQSGVKRIIFHFESTKHSEEIIKQIKEAGLEVGLAINPETAIEVVNDFIEQLDLVLVMTVQPGRGGQKFLEETLPKIKNLRAKYPNANIAVDGGINLETGPRVIQAGANILASGSAIFNSKNIEETIKGLQNLS